MHHSCIAALVSSLTLVVRASWVKASVVKTSFGQSYIMGEALGARHPWLNASHPPLTTPKTKTNYIYIYIYINID